MSVCQSGLVRTAFLMLSRLLFLIFGIVDPGFTLDPKRGGAGGTIPGIGGAFGTAGWRVHNYYVIYCDISFMLNK